MQKDRAGGTAAMRNTVRLQMKVGSSQIERAAGDAAWGFSGAAAGSGRADSGCSSYFSVKSWIEVSTGELAVNAALVAETTQDTAGGTVATAAGGEQQIPSVRLQCSQRFHWGAAW